VAEQFGLTLDESPRVLVGPLRLDLHAGQILFLVGPSGSGKSTVLRELRRRLAGSMSVGFPDGFGESSVIDAVAEGGSLGAAMNTLSRCGLGDPRAWLRRVEELSEGERFRAGLARALAGAAPGGAAAAPLLCDDFGALLDRRAGQALAWNVRRLATERGLCVVAAACGDALAADLRPDRIVRLLGDGEARVETPTARADAVPSIWHGLDIRPGCKADYDSFARLHYRRGDELGFVDKVFVLHDRAAGDRVGIVVYAHPPLESAPRNRATRGRFSRDPRGLNRHVRVLRRLVIRPELRGCGLGAHLVRCTLPLVGTEFVECRAAMGHWGGVFEKAGMTRLGTSEVPASARIAREALAELDVDPSRLEFAVEVARDRRVRGIVAEAVQRWYAATTGGGAGRAAHQGPAFLAQTFRGLLAAAPVYYLWRREAKKAASSTPATEAAARRRRRRARRERDPCGGA
jgi:ABC-type hemin transport system ATPase subunit